MSTPDQTLKVVAAAAARERVAEVEPRVHRPSLRLPFPPLPDAKGATQPTIHSFSTKGEREGGVVNSYWAGSFAFFANFPRD